MFSFRVLRGFANPVDSAIKEVWAMHKKKSSSKKPLSHGASSSHMPKRDSDTSISTAATGAVSHSVHVFEMLYIRCRDYFAFWNCTSVIDGFKCPSFTHFAFICSAFAIISKQTGL